MSDVVETLEQAEAMVNRRQPGPAKRLLGEVVEGVSDPYLRLRALRALSRAHRLDREFDEARARGAEALGIARELRDGGTEAVLLEGLGLTEAADGRFRAASEYLWASAEAERARGNSDGAAAALSNYAHMLIVNGLEGAEQILARALEDASPGSSVWATAADNMANELERQARHREAVAWGERAVEAYGALGAAYDHFVAMRQLARHLADAGQEDDAARVFQEAHDAIHAIRRSEVDVAHYEAYPERVAAIEARSQTVVGGTEAEAGLTIGMHVTLGREMLERGIAQFGEARFAEAVQSLLESRNCWLKLEAWHWLVRADHHLALTYIELGERRTAIDLTARVRSVAHGLGDASREAMAISTLARLTDLDPTSDPLDLLAQVHALDPLVARQEGAEDSPARRFTAGILAGQAAQICGDGSAYELAERYLIEAIERGRELPPWERYRLAYRLLNLYVLRRKAGQPERAATVVPELREVVASMGDDPRGPRVLARATARAAFADGDLSLATLDGLVGECVAYEQLRQQSSGGRLEGFAEAMDPPYDEAAEVAMALQRPGLALALLEHGKSRTLAEDMGLAAEMLPAIDEGDPPPPVTGDYVGLEVFARRDGLALFTVDRGTVTVTDVDATAVAALQKTAEALTDAADSERATRPVDDALDDVLTDVTFRRLCDALLRAVPPGREARLAPHRYLHQLPLQLASELAEQGLAVPWTVVPALAVARALPQPRIERPDFGVVVCGDPLGDLPFARAEARLVADVKRDALAIGNESHAEWLRHHCADSDVGVLHLACHGRFDRGRPERSGLLLAAPEQERFAGTSPAHLLTVADVAELPLEGMVVVLSACSSGLEVVRDGDEGTGLVSALLRAGASTVVAAQWPISDLSAMVMMLEFYARLRTGTAPEGIGATLGDAGIRLRDMTALEVARLGLSLAQDILDRGGHPREAVLVAAGCIHTALVTLSDSRSAAIVDELTEPWRRAEEGDGTAALRALEALCPARGDAHPFAHPAHWGAFAVIGRDLDGSGTKENQR